jgi:hypothetical protein
LLKHPQLLQLCHQLLLLLLLPLQYHLISPQLLKQFLHQHLLQLQLLLLPQILHLQQLLPQHLL